MRKSAFVRLLAVFGAAALAACGGSPGDAKPDGGTPDQPGGTTVSASASKVTFAAVEHGVQSGAVEVFLATNPAGDARVRWTAQLLGSPSWATVAPAEGGDRDRTLVTPSAAGLAPGTYTTTLRFTAPLAKNPVVDLTVTLTVLAEPAVFAPTAFEVGHGWGHVLRMADLDGDGHEDLVITNGEAGTVSVLLSSAAGFAAPREIGTGTNPLDLAIADLDGNGTLDLAVANSGGSVSVLLGDGHGGFSAAAPLGVTAPTGIAACDLDADGKLDLAVASQGNAGTEPGVRVFRGAGAGAFTDRGLVTTGATPTGIACADLDGDSKLDLAVTGAPGTGQDNLTFLPGDGHGGFSTGQPMAVGWGAFHPVVVDVDRDGHLDVVVATSGPRSIAVLYGTGTGSLGAPVQAGGIDGAAWVTVGDVTGDGLPDVLYLSNCLCDSTTTVVPNIGGSFTDSLAYSLPIGGASAQLADLDRDGILDYVVADWTGWVGIARGLPGGMAMSNSEPMALPRAATSGDLNGDGFPDVIVASGAQPGYVDVYLEFGPGAPARYSPVGLPSDVALGDFDEDGHPDVVVADQDSNVVALLRGTAGGALLPAVNHVVASSPVRLLVSDVDGDRHLDLVVATLGTTPGHPEGGLTVLHGDGHGQFAISATYAVSPLPKSIAMADVDGDGIADLVVAGGGAPALTILRGLGGGAFAPVPPNPDLLWHSVASFVLLMDIDGDSRTEIVSDDLSGGLLTFRWAADGHIDLVSRQDGFGFPDAVAVGDFNGDGRPDLAVAGPKGSLVSFWMGAGEGRFLPAPRRYATTFPVMGGGADFAVPRFLLAKDFNRDGYDDLLGSNGLGYSGAVFAIAGGMR